MAGTRRPAYGHEAEIQWLDPDDHLLSFTEVFSDEQAAVKYIIRCHTMVTEYGACQVTGMTINGREVAVDEYGYPVKPDWFDD